MAVPKTVLAADLNSLSVVLPLLLVHSDIIGFKLMMLLSIDDQDIWIARLLSVSDQQ